MATGDLLEAGMLQCPAVAPADNMDPVYAVVKRRSTTYCALFVGQAQDVDKWPSLLAADLFMDGPGAVIFPRVLSR